MPHATQHWYARPAARDWTCPSAPADAQAFHMAQAGYCPTRLVELPQLARELAVGRLFVKDESSRFGLPAFKALGAFWAVHRLLADRSVEAPFTLVTATDGNHGRAVAKAARIHGQRSQVFVPRGLHPTAVAAIAAEGAHVVTVAGTYDEAIDAACTATAAPGTLLVQDTGLPGREKVPGWIVDGYDTLFAEIDEQLMAAEAGTPGLLAVPAGVGSLAQAAVTHYRSRPGPGAALLAVEPASAACLLASLRQGEPVTVSTGETAMAGLNCGTPSPLAWPYLREGLDAAVTVTEEADAEAVHDLATLGVRAGPCGAASLAGLRTALTGQEADARRTALGLHPRSTVVLNSTEGHLSSHLPTPLADHDSRQRTGDGSSARARGG